MDKSKRKKGEFYLRKWAQAILDIERLQQDINMMRRKNTIFEDIYLKDKDDIIECYSKVLEEKRALLKDIIKDYKIIDDIINGLDIHKQNIIKLRYINKYSWQTVALQAHISLRQCFNVKNDIINIILKELEYEKNGVSI